ncbi:succinate dehydrogenase, cytochrome b556 subunit [Notoacmeibacter sp. MSK16QG-6]|uniref:succinate dehydrogenase, cytochrome b556 subunit n=1 Tax=Notoacmeibacter sp. MSK16QG-6 TaxID=2957982 RepID=UPI00209DF090|nr:succinate dehydrogenase, cytochrome b556 subunit [Notoacmeibacter sp. MSK16QG-6]MCP1199200.1 succinate dehydrogenase, cytochrome b556 subunit [Notoacmeibacter sp. MSK16QG-6]
MSTNAPMRPRPLSPHLQIYKPIPSMMMSILHRLTGVGLYFGMAIVALFLLALAGGEGGHDLFSELFGSIIGIVVLFLFSWVLFHHMLGGVRHLVWDFGHLLSREESRSTSMALPAVSLVMTVICWLIAWLLV